MLLVPATSTPGGTLNGKKVVSLALSIATDASVFVVIVPFGMFERATSVPLMYTTAPSSRRMRRPSAEIDAGLATEKF